MFTSLNNKYIVVEGGYWFQCYYYYVYSQVFNNKIRHVGSLQEICNDIFGDYGYSINFSNIDLDTFVDVGIDLHINLFSEKESKSLQKKIDITYSVNQKNIISFFDNICKNHKVWEEIKKITKEHNDYKKLYMNLINIPGDVIEYNNSYKSNTYNIINASNIFSEDNNLYFFSQYKSCKLQFIIKYMSMCGYDEIKCIESISSCYGKLYSDKHVGYTIKNLNSLSGVHQNYYIYSLLSLLKMNNKTSEKWFNIIYHIIDLIVDNNKLHNDEKNMAKKLVKEILNKKACYA